MILRLIKLSLVFFFLLTIFWPKQTYALPEPTGFVNDFADVLSPQFEESLEEKLANFSDQTGPEIAIVTITNLEGDTVENYAVELFNDWEIGKKDQDNGVLFLAAISDRKMRIEVGYGAEAQLNDAKAGRIIRDTIAPEFKKENYETGIAKAADSIITSLQEKTDEKIAQPSTPKETQSPSFIALILFASVFSYLAAFFARSKSWWAGGIVGFLIGLFTSLTVAGIFAIIGLILDFILSSNFKKLKKAKKPTSFWPTKGGFWTGGGKTGGFGGFGGGRSGGGGASGGW